jgi:hypothetical protein
LENALRAFMVVLLGTLQTQVSLECILRLVFERSGARIGPTFRTERLIWMHF